MKIDYKETLNLPGTPFPMKANLAQREPNLLKKWAENQVYQALETVKRPKGTFLLADGPPYANGPIHIGHAVNKILKDFVIKSKQLSGYHVPYVPGWDCHGLPVELNVEKKFGKPGVKIDHKTFRQKCREYVAKQVDLQRDAFVRLGILGEWENPYLTMNYAYEANIIRALAKVVRKGSLRKGHKPVHWCLSCGSALAEAEVEYENKSSPSIYVGFPVVTSELLKQLPPGTKVSVVIWTTTSWTLPGNQAVSIHPDYHYALVKSQNKYYLIANELVEKFSVEVGLEDHEVVATWLGKELDHTVLQHPFYDKKIPVFLGQHVTLEAGTGCVHTAPAHGQEDYAIWQEYCQKRPDHLQPYTHLQSVENWVDGSGCYISDTPLFAGEHVTKVHPKVMAALQEKGNLIFETSLEHSYPHCWRHHTPLIFRATQQWFISMDAQSLREKSLQAIEQVDWSPSWGQARIEGMVRDRPDWCVSRQRTWCVPMCLFLHRETGEYHPRTPELMEKVAALVDEHGLDAWYDLSIETMLGEAYKDYEKSHDTLDVWFDSGVSHECVLKQRAGLTFPADLYLEGSDQHRGWFQSSLLSSVAINDCAPYKQVLTHGFVVDAQGRKMSKSLGNVVSPEKVVNSLGADVLRLWVAATDYRSEMVVSDDILKQVSDIYRRIRNTIRFLLSNLNGFDNEKHRVPSAQMLSLDKWVVEKTQILQAEITTAFDEYQFHTAYQKIHRFCSVELGSFYLDVIKDRQYTGKSDGLPRRSAQTAMFYIVEALVRWIAPILTFTAEEVWENLPNRQSTSVLLDEWFVFPDALTEKTSDTFWQDILLVRNAINKALETARTDGRIGSGLEAELTCYCDAGLYAVLQKLEDELRFVFITSRATIARVDERPASALPTDMPGLWLEVVASKHTKCARCWHRRSDVSADPDYPEICQRCVENIREGDGERRQYA